MLSTSLRYFALACISLPGMFVFNLLVLTVALRVFIRMLEPLLFGEGLKLEELLPLGETLALRMITVGVLILERHEILEMTGRLRSEDDDELTRVSSPFGQFYLCGGLLLECFVDELQHPFRLFEGPVQQHLMSLCAGLFVLGGLVVSVGYAIELIRYFRRLRQVKA